MTMLELLDALLDAATEPDFDRNDAPALAEIQWRLTALRDARYTETGVAVADILDGK